MLLLPVALSRLPCHTNSENDALCMRHWQKF